MQQRAKIRIRVCQKNIGNNTSGFVVLIFNMQERYSVKTKGLFITGGDWKNMELVFWIKEIWDSINATPLKDFDFLFIQ